MLFHGHCLELEREAVQHGIRPRRASRSERRQGQRRDCQVDPRLAGEVAPIGALDRSGACMPLYGGPTHNGSPAERTYSAYLYVGIS